MQGKIEKIFYPNDLVFVLGGGVSVTDEQVKQIKDYFIIGTNGAVLFGSWIDILFFGDSRFYNWSQEHIDNFPNRVITCAANNIFKDHAKVEQLGRKEDLNDPICWDKRKVCWPTNEGGNTGASALALACKLGSKNIVLLGFDFQQTQDKHNFHNLSEAHHKPRSDIYNRFYQHFEAIKNEADKYDILIRNATPNSKLDLFPTVDIKDFI